MAWCETCGSANSFTCISANHTMAWHSTGLWLDYLVMSSTQCKLLAGKYGLIPK